jgi:hypothetical protein
MYLLRLLIGVGRVISNQQILEVYESFSASPNQTRDTLGGGFNAPSQARG